MKRSYVYAIIAAVIIVASIASYLALHNKNSTGSMNSMNMSNSSPANGNNSRTATNSVTIQDFAFSPSAISVKVGTKVTWTNRDSTTHTVTEIDSLAGPNSSDINSGSSYSFTFTKAGTYHYHCAIHPSMTGTVTVAE